MAATRRGRASAFNALPLPEPAPGDDGAAPVTPPPVAGGARSRWSTDVAGKRAGSSRTMDSR